MQEAPIYLRKSRRIVDNDWIFSYLYKRIKCQIPIFAKFVVQN
ncbi:hypothetical protein ABIE26_004555 [Pedobacter africanus]